MSPTTQEPIEPRSLEQELHELQSEEKRFEYRLQKTQVATLVASVFAVLASVAAIAVALANKSNTTQMVVRGTAPASRPAAGMPGGAMMGGAGGAATSRTINVQLGEMYAHPSASSITAGKVTFVAHNVGKLTHELMIERMPIKMEAAGKPVEKAAQGMVDDMMPGDSGKMTLKLKPGTYMLFCNVPGHYAAGQHTVFTVTKS